MEQEAEGLGQWQAAQHQLTEVGQTSTPGQHMRTGMTAGGEEGSRGLGITC